MCITQIRLASDHFDPTPAESRVVRREGSSNFVHRFGEAVAEDDEYETFLDPLSVAILMAVFDASANEQSQSNFEKKQGQCYRHKIKNCWLPQPQF